MSIPIIFGRSNPFYSPLLDYNISSGAIQWVTMPEAYFPPFFRTPEPQFSLFLIALVVFIAVKKKSFIPLYLVMPFLYPFIRIPFMFVVMTLHMIGYVKGKNLFKWKVELLGPIFIVYAGVSLMIIIYKHF